MTEYEAKLAIGSLLHDIGKVIFRWGDDHRNHSVSGYDYLKTEVGLTDRSILNCVKYHHSALLKSASVPSDDLCYIVYMADNIAAMSDRRKKGDGAYGFETSTPMESIFNILNGNDAMYYHAPGDMDPEGEINYPQIDKLEFDKFKYSKIKQRITENLKGLCWDREHVNSLLEVMEANLTFVPSSTAAGERADISLFDHVKLTAAIASCIYKYIQENKIDDLKRYLFIDGKKFYEKEVFLLFSMDISGIQKFIYTVTTKNALRTLRARSFYLEVMMEHIIDGLLEQLGLSRTNLLYCGGGHCYMLLPNTESVKIQIDSYLEDINQWFILNFGTALYIAGAYALCNSRTLRNDPEGSYSNLFRQVSSQISKIKLNRYSAKQIRFLNQRVHKDYTRECCVCKRIGETDSEGVCRLCRKFEKFSQSVLYDDAFSVLRKDEPDALPLPGGSSLTGDDLESLRTRMIQDDDYVRTYTKNKMFTGKYISTKLWVGDYTTGQTFEEFAAQGTGIERIGVLRADVDNLGQTFVSGFDSPVYGDQYNTLSRTAVLSRKLSTFFKLHIREILKHGQFSLTGEPSDRQRKATIIYSGGDDVFIVGHWLDIIEFAIDLKNSFKQFTQGTLTLSAGIGIYDSSYPIRVIAEETGAMESASKSKVGKDSVTLLEDGAYHLEDGLRISDGTYTWSEFEEQVLGEKYTALCQFLDGSEDHGMAFMYHLLELLRQKDDKINFARLVYIMSRMEPKEEGADKERYEKFSQKIYQWIRSDDSDKDCRQLKTAMTLYAYVHRKKEEGDYADQ